MLRLASFAVALSLIALNAFPEPKNAILFIGDGMGVTQITAARIYSANARDGELTLDTFEQVALVRTYSASTMVTDSAASGTAMATGHKTNTLDLCIPGMPTVSKCRPHRRQSCCRSAQ